MDYETRLENFNWYIEHLRELYDEYGSVFVAIKDNAVLCCGDSYKEALHNALKEAPLGSFIVQKCGTDSSAYTNFISSMNFSDARNRLCFHLPS